MASERPNDAVATYLRQRLDERGMTSAALARELGVSKNTVTNWTKGKHRPQRKHAEAMAVALQTSPQAFLSGHEDRATDPEAHPDGGEEPPSTEAQAHSDGGEEAPSSEAQGHSDGREETPSAEAPGKKRMAAERERRPSAGSTVAVVALAVGLIATGFGLFSPAADYRIPLLLGVAALAVGVVARRQSVGSRRGLAIAGTLLGAVALAAGIWGAVMVEATVSGLVDFGKDAASKKREKFCDSKKGDKLDRLTSPATDSARQLRRQTRDALKAARRAPDNAECAAGALDSIATTWNRSARSPGYGDAKRQVNRIRRFQRRNNLMRETKFCPRPVSSSGYATPRRSAGRYSLCSYLRGMVRPDQQSR
jgi:transcriptional regulator with XRE-family HTH domain